jgi:hypothetical protein
LSFYENWAQKKRDIKFSQAIGPLRRKRGYDADKILKQLDFERVAVFPGFFRLNQPPRGFAAPRPGIAIVIAEFDGDFASASARFLTITGFLWCTLF